MPVPTHDLEGRPLTRDGHVINAGVSPFRDGEWLVYIYPNHTDMAHSWEAQCGWASRYGAPCVLRPAHRSSHANDVRVSPRSTYSYPVNGQKDPS